MSEQTTEQDTETKEPTEQTDQTQRPDQSNQELEKIKAELDAIRKQKADAENLVNEFQGKLKAAEEEKLKSTNNYKKLYENAEQEKKTLEERLNKFSNSVVMDKKINSVREIAIKQGIDERALEDLSLFDLSDVVVETTDQGRINVLGAESFVNKMKESRPYLFKDKNPATINNGTGNYNGGDKTFTPAEVNELRSKDPKLYKEIMTKKQHLIKRS